MLPQPSSARKFSPIVGRGSNAPVQDHELISNDLSGRYSSDEALSNAAKSGAGKPFVLNSMPEVKFVDVRQISENQESAPEAIQVTIHLAEHRKNASTQVSDAKMEKTNPSSLASGKKPNLPPRVLPRATAPAQSIPEDNSESDENHAPAQNFPIRGALFRPFGFFKQRPRLLVATSAAALLGIGLFLGSLLGGGKSEDAKNASASPGPAVFQEINDALAHIESGDSSEALRKIQNLSLKHPDISSLDYLAALAAMQSGDFKTAQEKASLSIQKNQKVSDSLVLLSMSESLAGGSEKSSLRDPKLVRESLLRQAVESDVSNPFPMIELASFLRSQNRDEEALQLLKAANCRLHPIDTHVVVATSLQLMRLQQTPDEKLPEVVNEGSISDIFASIYISLRKKDYNQAAIALEKGRHQASPDLFSYLINDPVFKPFRAEPVMTRAM